MLTALAFYTLLGLLAGFLSGLLGIGGGVVLVPGLLALFSWFSLEGPWMHMAVGTSLAAMVFVSGNSLRAHHKRGSIDWSLFTLMVPTVLIGVVFGLAVGDSIPTEVLKKIFAGFLALIGLNMIVARQAAEPSRRMSTLLLRGIGVTIGFCAGLLGIGGGILMVPLFHAQGLSMPRASGTSVACAWPTALIGGATAVFVGLDNVSSAQAFTTGYVYWPAILGISMGSLFSTSLGAYWAHRLPTGVLKRAFGGLLLIVAARMVI